MISNVHALAVLPVLKAMKACIDANDSFVMYEGKPFNLSREAGICWHLYAHTVTPSRGGVDYHFLKPVFVDLGLDKDYPVEMQLGIDKRMAGQMYFKSPHLYRGEVGEIRVKLLETLIQYFENILSKELA